MSSLWTPEGEYRVSEQTDDAADLPPPGEDHADSPPDEADVEALRDELLAAPVEDIVANHCFGLFELAALHLGARPPNLEKARLAIDGLGGVVDTLGDRLGAHSDTLKDALSSIRLAFVEISKPRDGEGTAAPNDEDASGT